MLIRYPHVSKINNKCVWKRKSFRPPVIQHDWHVGWFDSWSKPGTCVEHVNLNDRGILALRSLLSSLVHVLWKCGAYPVSFLYIIICCGTFEMRRALISRRYGQAPSWLSLLARVVSLAKCRKNVEQKWHCVQPLDHWMLVREFTGSIYYCACTSVADFASARCECTCDAQAPAGWSFA